MPCCLDCSTEVSVEATDTVGVGVVGLDIEPSDARTGGGKESSMYPMSNISTGLPSASTSGTPGGILTKPNNALFTIR